MSKKGVMLSQQSSTNGGLTQSRVTSSIGGMGSKATLGSGGPSIGNYKGVMLCNRPFAGVRAALKQTSSSKGRESASFKTGIPDGRSALGLSPAKRLLPHAKPVRKVTAMDKHKTWLRKFQEKRQTMEEKMLEEEEQKKQRRQRFREREQKKRQDVVGVRRRENLGEGDENVGNNEGKTADESDSEIDVEIEEGKYEEVAEDAKYDDDDDDGVVDESKNGDETKDESKYSDNDVDDYVDDDESGDDKDDDDVVMTASQMRKIKRRKKPAWAYAEGGKEKEEEDLEEEELAELLDFTNNLDFEDFIEDLEVKDALEKLRKRVEELTPRRRDRVRGQVLVQRGMDGEALLQMKDGLRPLTKEALDELDRELRNQTAIDCDYDTRSVVSDVSILSDAKSLRSVHSAKSIKAIRKRMEAKKKRKQLLKIREEEVVDESVYKEPVIVTNDEESGKLDEQFEAGRLPYIRRNPAV